MIRRYTIVRQTSVCATLERCWPYLTDPQLIGEWFADTRGAFVTGGNFEFHFGDGDFFRGFVQAADEPVSLRFRWQFMGVGLTSEIEYALLPLGGGQTMVTVIDRSEHTDAGAAEMCEGWDDFLSRLARRIRTGENSRYRWTETIGCGAVFPGTPENARTYLRDRAVWAAFPQTETVVSEGGDELTVSMASPAWNGCETEATLGFRLSETGTYVSVIHRGFDLLSADIQFDERRRYAAYWAAFLAELEAEVEGVAGASPAGVFNRTMIGKQN